MPKVTLTFRLPEEKEEFELASKGIDYFCAVSDLDNLLRNFIKYPPADATDEAVEIYETIRSNLRTFLTERGIYL